jgi:hypothetical protein
MSESDRTVSRPRFGGGGRLYRDARELIEEARSEEMAPDPPPWADAPAPAPPPRENPPPMKVGKIEAPTEPKPPTDWREGVSTGLELVGIGLLITTGFLIAVWVGTLIAGLSLVLLGVATSRKING